MRNTVHSCLKIRYAGQCGPVDILLAGYGAGIPADPDRHNMLRKSLSKTVVYGHF